MLKKVLVFVGVAVASLFVANQANAADYIRGHYRSNGSYVQPHYRSTSDGYFSNNWSTYGNVNPYTGSYGTRHYPSYGSSSYGSYGYGSYGYGSYGR